MLFLHAPLNYLFTLFYFVLTIGLVTISDSLLVLWTIIELQIIIYLVVSLPYFRLFHSSIILYFLIQSVSSLIVLGFAFFSDYLLILSLSINLGVFPFYGWYLASLPSFPPFPLFLGLTLQNLPSILILNLFFSGFSTILLVVVVTFGFLGGLSSIPSAISMRVLLVWSSLLTNTWFVLGISQSLSTFLIYFIIYAALVLFITFFSSFYSFFYSGWIILLLFSMGGFPPFPLFFANLFVLYHCAMTLSASLVFFVLLSSVISIYLYCSISLSFFTQSYSNI